MVVLLLHFMMVLKTIKSNKMMLPLIMLATDPVVLKVYNVLTKCHSFR